MTALVASRRTFLLDHETPTPFDIDLWPLADTLRGWLNAGKLLEGPTGVVVQRIDDLAIESALRTGAGDIEHARARLKEFRQLDNDWDGEGALAPNEEVLDGAAAFLTRLQPWHPRPAAGLDSDGNPVIEFHDDETALFGKVRFTSPHNVEIFSVNGGGATEYLEGSPGSEQVLRFLSDQLQITLRP